MDDAQLRTVWQQRQRPPGYVPISWPLGALMKHTLSKRFRQLNQLAGIWDEVVPAELREHTALESFGRGVLTVMVDSSPHRFQLQSLLAAGLKAHIQSCFSGALNKIHLVPGQFYSVDSAGAERYEF